MTWQLFSPDLPFLNQITVSQIKYGFWENAVTYAPVISAACSLFGIVITYMIARKAREISSEQKQIAQNKLDMEVFEKRFSVCLSFKKFYLKTISPNIEDYKYFPKLIEEIETETLMVNILFLEPDVEIIEKIKYDLIELFNFRIDHTNINDIFKNPEVYDNYEKLRKNAKEGLDKLHSILRYYSPEFVKTLPRNKLSTAHPASPDTPPPAAPAADQ
ncbi:hypothetical protein [Acetobacter pasteurianus]|uniref:hypothetical protein n=1 Tax=Acetobacter pasteurianus TaxID=438 RepID=UPI003D1256F6